jgi:deoxyxylulose-5-phosphate synthase
MWSDVRKATYKNRIIQETLDKAKQFVANSEVTQALDEIRLVKKRIQDLFEGGAETKWSWFHLKYIVPESGKVLNELITKLEEFQKQQPSAAYSL